MGEKLNSEGQRVVRSRTAVGALLLVLLAHAFVASATHFHRSFVPVGGSAHSALQSRDGVRQSAPASGDASCFLCRLQRNFVSDVQHSAPAPAAPPATALKHEPLQLTPVLTARLLLRSGRAPPLA